LSIIHSFFQFLHFTCPTSFFQTMDATIMTASASCWLAGMRMPSWWLPYLSTHVVCLVDSASAIESCDLIALPPLAHASLQQCVEQSSHVRDVDGAIVIAIGIIGTVERIACT